MENKIFKEDTHYCVPVDDCLGTQNETTEPYRKRSNETIFYSQIYKGYKSQKCINHCYYLKVNYSLMYQCMFMIIPVLYITYNMDSLYTNQHSKQI